MQHPARKSLVQHERRSRAAGRDPRHHVDGACIPAIGGTFGLRHATVSRVARAGMW